MRLILASVLLVLVACNSADTKKENVSVTGAYKMLSQTFKSTKPDSTINAPSTLQQLKIFTDDLMMYANVNTADSMTSFGVGSYTVSGDTVKETVFFNASDTSKNESSQTFDLFVEKTAKGYKQMIPNIDTSNGGWSLTEEYESAGTDVKSAIDGLWKQTKTIYINGKDTQSTTGTQYKIYSAGNIIFGGSHTDSLKKNHTVVGIGTFTMSSATKLKETMKYSNINDVAGHDFDLDIAMNGADEFTQTIMYSDKEKGIETYQRVKK